MCYLPIGVIRDGLTHPSIPDGWRWNGLVSDHCPVWAEFYCDRDYDRATDHVTVDDIFIDGKQREGWCTIAWGCCIIKLLNSNDLFQGKKGESGLNVLTVSSSLFRGNGRVIYLPRSCRRSTCVGVLQVKWSLETLDFEERVKALFPEKWTTECVAALK